MAGFERAFGCLGGGGGADGGDGGGDGGAIPALGDVCRADLSDVSGIDVLVSGWGRPRCRRLSAVGLYQNSGIREIRLGPVDTVLQKINKIPHKI